MYLQSLIPYTVPFHRKLLGILFRVIIKISIMLVISLIFNNKKSLWFHLPDSVTHPSSLIT